MSLSSSYVLQEDSVIINKGAVDRGMLTTTAFKTYRDEERKNQTELMEETFMKPTANTYNARANYDAIDDNGLPIKGKKVTDGDVIIGKAVQLKGEVDGVRRYRDASYVVGLGEGGEISEVRSGVNGDGFTFCKVKIAKVRPPSSND